MQFPRNESDIVALATAMIAGLAEHGADFPSAEAAALEAALGDYHLRRAEQVDMQSRALQATVAKQEALAVLSEQMRKTVKLCEADAIDRPTVLTEIGWGPRLDRHKLTAPNQPHELVMEAQGHGFVWLQWKKAASGAKAASYIIERREGTGGDFSQWRQVATSFAAEVKLTDQPQGVDLEYQVSAANGAGQSRPSNIAAIVYGQQSATVA